MAGSDSRTFFSPLVSSRVVGGTLGAALLLFGCSDADEGRGDGGGGGGIASLTADGDGTGDPIGSDGGQDDALDSDGGSVAFDLGNDDGNDDGAAEASMDQGCRSVDFLFVIDNSVSMEDNQASLVGAFPGFIAAIEAALEDSDFHILVTDTDAWGRCDTVNGFVGIDPTSNTCNEYINTTPFAACDAVRGAGVVHPAGEYASNTVCDVVGGTRWLGPDEPDLGAAFACMATVGVAGNSSERPMEAIIAALSPELEDGGGCNAGFLRDDALLVVTFVSDDPNREDEGMPQDWYDAVVAAKLGDPSSVVVLGMTPAWPDCQQDPTKLNGAHWAEFLGLWGDHGVHGDVCGSAADYVTFFESTVSTIDQACDEYTPPG